MTISPRLWIAIPLVALVAAPATAATVAPHQQPTEEAVAIDVWLGHEDGAVYAYGQTLNINFRTNADAYVAIYNVDSMGGVNLLYPRYGDPQWVEAGRVGAIPGPDAGYDLVVDGAKGIEYVVGVASRYPLQLSALEPDTSNWNQPAGTGVRITGDPSEAIWELNEQLTWGGEGREPEGYASDVSWFYTRAQVPYPRYLVYDWYPDRYWDPYWDPYVSVNLWVDWHWDNHWCGARWYRWGHRPHYDYWYRTEHYGPQLRWKGVHEVIKPGAPYRTKPGRPPVALRDAPRATKPSRAPSVWGPAQVPRVRSEAKPVQRPSVRGERPKPQVKPEARPSKPEARPEKPRAQESKPRPESKPQAKARERKPEAKPAEKPKSQPESRPKRR